MALSKIAVIVLNGKSASDTHECLASVYASSDPNYAVYVADYGSTDDLSKLKQAYPRAIYLDLGTNRGFAEGINQAIIRAIEDGADYLFLLNNNAIVKPDTLSILRQAAVDHPNAAALGPTIYFYDDPKTIWFGGARWDPAKSSFIHCNNESKAIEKTGYVSRCALFAPVSLIRKVGLMDKRFFFNWEEIDWCSRMQRAGFDCLSVPEAKVWHKVSLADGEGGPAWHYFDHRNRLLWMERNLTPKARWRIAIYSLWPEFKRLIVRSFGKDRQNERAAIKGTLDYLFRRFGDKKLL
jgi:GT2 family glycosyltransferase